MVAFSPDSEKVMIFIFIFKSCSDWSINSCYHHLEFWVFMLRHKILKSKFKRPAKLLISLGVR